MIIYFKKCFIVAGLTDEVLDQFETNIKSLLDTKGPNVGREDRVKLQLDVLMPVAAKWYLSSLTDHSAKKMEYYILRWFNVGMK